MTDFWHISLIFHIFAVCMVVGAAISDFVLLGHFSKKFASDPANALHSKETIDKIARIYPFGSSLLILSGICILWSTGWIYATQPWFHIKMLLFIILIVNGNVFARKASTTISKNLQAGSIDAGVINPSLSRLRMIVNIQIAIAIIIFTLAVFKFH